MSIPIEDIRPRVRVCVVGIGTAAFIHEHTHIERITPTMIILANKRRYRRNGVQESIPYAPYSGTRIYRTCQRPKDVKGS